MKLRDCNLEFDFVMMDPFLRESAEANWKEAIRSEQIPESLFRFYTVAGYLSMDKAPEFLADTERVLFSYLATVINGIRECLVESRELLDDVVKLEKSIYSPTKKTGDRASSSKQRRSLRYFLLNISSALDLLSEVIALFFPTEIKRLKVGRASWPNVYKWLEDPLSPPDGSFITPPSQYYLERLHGILRPLTVRQAPETDWIKLLQLYRNKLSHFGGSSILDYRLQDKKGEWYAFLPRRWPFIWQSHVQVNQALDVTEARKARSSKLAATINDSCIHIDLVEFSEGLTKRVREVIQEAFTLLVEAYDQFQGFPLNEDALESLRKNFESYEFLEFVEE